MKYIIHFRSETVLVKGRNYYTIADILSSLREYECIQTKTSSSISESHYV